MANWQIFNDFLLAEGFSLPKVLQCEVTYVNLIAKRHGWQKMADWWQVFPFLAQPMKTGFLPPPESQRFNVNYVMPNENGRLRISVVNTVKDGDEAIAMNVTARGKPASSDLNGILTWMDLGREWVVKGFTDFTSSEMHKIWQKEA